MEEDTIKANAQVLAIFNKILECFNQFKDTARPEVKYIDYSKLPFTRERLKWAISINKLLEFGREGYHMPFSVQFSTRYGSFGEYEGDKIELYDNVIIPRSKLIS